MMMTMESPIGNSQLRISIRKKVNSQLKLKNQHQQQQPTDDADDANDADDYFETVLKLF